MGPSQLRREISRAQNLNSQVTGRSPISFRDPAGLRSPLLDPVLQSLDLKLVSWTRRGFDTVSSDPDQVLKRLQKNFSAGDILLLHDGNCSADAKGRPVVLDVLPQLLASAKARGLRAVSLHDAA